MKHANRYISVLYRYSQRYFAQQLKQRNLPLETGEMPFLLQICEHPGCSQEFISSEIQMDKATVARAVSRLEQRGLVNCELYERDHRRKALYATEKGQEVYRSCQEILNQYHEVLYHGMKPEEIEQAVHLLIQMKHNVSESISGNAENQKN